MADDSAMRDQAEAVLADARARLADAEVSGRSYAIALHRTRIAQAQLILDEPAAALVELDQAAHYLDMLESDGEHERLYLLRAMSPGLPPVDDESGDINSLRLMLLVTRASAQVRKQLWADARVTVDTARPLARGWRRRDLRKTLDALSDEIARADGSATEAISAIDRGLSDPTLNDTDRLAARYERAAHLADEGRFDEAIREALTLIRDSGDDPHITSRARQVLGASLAAQGRHDDADAALSAAFTGFRDSGDDAALIAAAPGLGWLLNETGQHLRAVEVLQVGLAAAQRLGDVGAQVDLESALGATYDAEGDVGAAVAAFDRAVTLAESVEDVVRAADARHGEAIVRGRQSDTHEAVEALSLLDRSASDYATHGLPERAAACEHEAAALLARLGSHSAAQSRYEIARNAYLAIPEILRGDDPEAVADCERNLALLRLLQADPTTVVPPGAFVSGGHQMRHGVART